MGLDWCPKNCSRFNNYEPYRPKGIFHTSKAKCLLFKTELVNVKGTQSAFYRLEICINEFGTELPIIDNNEIFKG